MYLWAMQPAKFHELFIDELGTWVELVLSFYDEWNADKLGKASEAKTL